MRVFLAGGTGAVGRHALRALVSAEHEVSAIVRSEESAQWVRLMGGEPVHVSLFDREDLRRAVGKHDAVVNLATAIPPTSHFMRASAWEMNDRIRSEGSANLVDAALAGGAERFVQESVAMVYADRGSDWIDEEWRTERFPMAQGNHAAETSARRFADAGGTGVILRFGWFYGPGATHSEEFLDLARRRGVCVMMGPPTTYVSSIHMEDAGAAVAAALKLPSGVYNVVDDQPLTKRDYADALAAAAGRRRYLRAPGRLALLLGNKTTSLTRSLRVSNEKLRRSSTWTPRYPSAWEGWRAMAKTLSRFR